MAFPLLCRLYRFRLPRGFPVAVSSAPDSASIQNGGVRRQALTLSDTAVSSGHVEASLVRRFQELSDQTGFKALEWEDSMTVLKEHMSDLSPRTIASLLHFLKVHGHPPPQAVSLLVQAAKARLHKERFTDIGASTVVHSLACLVRSSRGGLTPALESEMCDLALHLTEELVIPQRICGLTDRILANVMYGLGVLFKSHEDACQRNPRLKECVEALSAEICEEHHLVSFAQQGLANILYAYGCLRWRSDFVLIRLSREIINRVGGFRSQEIAYMILSLAKLQYRQEKLILTLGLEAMSGQHITRFTEQDLCHVLYGLQYLSAGIPSSEQLQPVLDRLLREAGSAIRMSKYNSQDLSTLIFCIASLAHGKPVTSSRQMLALRFLEKFEALMKRRPKLDKQLSSVLHSCARMNLIDDRFLATANSHIVQKCRTLDSAWTLSLILWALTSLEALTPEAFLALCHRLCDLRGSGEKMADPNWVQLTQAIRYMENHRQRVEIDPRLKDLLEEALNVVKSTDLEFTLPETPFKDQERFL